VTRARREAADFDRRTTAPTGGDDGERSRGDVELNQAPMSTTATAPDRWRARGRDDGPSSPSAPRRTRTRRRSPGSAVDGRQRPRSKRRRRGFTLPERVGSGDARHRKQVTRDLAHAEGVRSSSSASRRRSSRTCERFPVASKGMKVSDLIEVAPDTDAMSAWRPWLSRPSRCGASQRRVKGEPSSSTNSASVGGVNRQGQADAHPERLRERAVQPVAPSPPVLRELCATAPPQGLREGPADRSTRSWRPRCGTSWPTHPGTKAVTHVHSDQAAHRLQQHARRGPPSRSRRAWPRSPARRTRCSPGGSATATGCSGPLGRATSARASTRTSSSSREGPDARQGRVRVQGVPQELAVADVREISTPTLPNRGSTSRSARPTSGCGWCGANGAASGRNLAHDTSSRSRTSPLGARPSCRRRATSTCAGSGRAARPTAGGSRQWSSRGTSASCTGTRSSSGGSSRAPSGMSLTWMMLSVCEISCHSLHRWQPHHPQPLSDARNGMSIPWFVGSAVEISPEQPPTSALGGLLERELDLVRIRVLLVRGRRRSASMPSPRLLSQADRNNQ